MADERARRIIAALEVSLDGLIEGPDGEVDWIGSWEDSFGRCCVAPTQGRLKA